MRPFAEGITFPVLYDRHHVLSELYAISNVPTALWIDEEGAIARPNGVTFGTDMFKDFTGVSAEPGLNEIRRWVREGTLPVTREEALTAVGDLSEDEVLARLHFRLGAQARRDGATDAAARHFARAGELAPHDWTIRRAAMPLNGGDPFGQEFFELYQEWEAVGRPYHGLPATTE